MIKKFLDAKTKTAEKDGSFEIIASMGKRDRMGDLIDPKGWYLKNYKKNPVILWSHSTGGFGSMAIPPVGKATKTWIDNEKELRMKGQFAETPFAQELKTLVNGGFLNAVSVGFLPLVEDIKGTIDIEEKMYRRVNEVEMKAYSEGGSVEINEKIYGKGGEVFSKQELLEVSWVSVPALPQALVTAKEMNLGLVTKAMEQEIEFETEWEKKEGEQVWEKREEADKEMEEEKDVRVEDPDEGKEKEEVVEDKEESKSFEERLSEAEKVINELREAKIPESVTSSKDETKGRKALIKKKSKKSDMERLLIMVDKVFETLLRKLRQND